MLIKYLTPFVFLFILSFNTNGQWTRTSGPEGCYATSLVRLPNSILCGTYQGIYQSFNEGVSWTDFPFFQSRAIQSMISYSDTLIILHGTGFMDYDILDSLFCSTSFDGGNSWSTPIYINDIDHARLYKYDNAVMISGDYALSISYDYGLSLTAINFPVGLQYYHATFFEKYFIISTVDSLNYGPTYWVAGGDTVLDTLSTNQVIRQFSVIDSTFFGYRKTIPDSIEILRSTDFGQSWQVIKIIRDFPSFNLLVIDNLLYHAAQFGGHHVSSDFGNTWSLPMLTPRHYNYPVWLPLQNGDELLGGGYLMHYVTSNNSVYPSQTGIVGSYIYNVKSNTNKIYASGHGALFGTNNNGITWDTISSINSYSDFYVF